MEMSGGGKEKKNEGHHTHPHTLQYDLPARALGNLGLIRRLQKSIIGAIEMAMPSCGDLGMA